MAEKNKETESAFIDELSLALGEDKTMRFHFLIRDIRQSRNIEEGAREYAHSILTIIGHNQNLVRRFLESVHIPEPVEAFLSDPNFYNRRDYEVSTSFWPTYITEAERAERRKRKSADWSEACPAKQLVVEKIGESEKKDVEDADKVHQEAGSSQAIHSNNNAHISCSEGEEEDDHVSSESVDSQGDELEVKFDSPESLNSNDEKSLYWSGGEGLHVNGSSESEKVDECYEDDEEISEVESDSSYNFHGNYESLPSYSELRDTDEQSGDSSESMEKDSGSSGSDTSESSYNENQKLTSSSESGDTDEQSGDSSESVEKEDISENSGDNLLEVGLTNSGNFCSDNQALSSSEDEETEGHLDNRYELLKEGDSSREDEESVEEEENSEKGGDNLLEVGLTNSENFCSDNQALSSSETEIHLDDRSELLKEGDSSREDGKVSECFHPDSQTFQSCVEGEKTDRYSDDSSELSLQKDHNEDEKLIQDVEQDSFNS